MKTMEINFKTFMLSTAFVVLSGITVSNLFDKKPSGAAYAAVPSGLNNPSVSTAPLISPEKKEELKTIQAITSAVRGFEPVFDDEWCQSRYPQYKGKKISIQSHEFIVKDHKGTKITDYNELSLQLAPSGREDKQLEKQFRFDNAYVDVKGIGPMKIKAVKFTFVDPSKAGE